MTRAFNHEALEFVDRQEGLFTYSDFTKAGFHKSTLKLLVEQGRVRKIGHAVYAPGDLDETLHEEFAELALRHPRAVICHDSAANFHGLSVKPVSSVHAAFTKDGWRPYGATLMDWKPIEVVTWTPVRMEEGVEEIQIHNVGVRITSAARTVVDMLCKYGTDEVSVHCMETFLRDKGTVADLKRAAEAIGRMRPVEPHLDYKRPLASF